MTATERIQPADLESLKILPYPHPVLREQCIPVDDPTAPALAALIERMFELMFAARGVGLAAPQVGVGVRFFLASPSFEPSDRRVYINPEIVSGEGSQDDDEGCLSFPGIYSKVRRHNIVTIRAIGLDGQAFEETGEGLAARIFEHESDHLEGRLLVDRMSSVARLANRKALKTLETAAPGR